MWHNPISDINPLTDLTNLQVLKAANCSISDISALRNLPNLIELNLQSNNITDIHPLANLTQLTALYLASNNISDVKPLAHLTHLTTLEIQNNKIADHSPLDALPLVHFEYDQSCEMPPLPLEPRLENRSFPSVLAAWGGLGRSPVVNQPYLSAMEHLAQHDLYFSALMFRQTLFNTGNGWEIRGNLETAEQLRDDFLALNPNMVFLVEIRMRTEWIEDYPEDWPHWLRDAEGNIPALESGSPTALIDFTHSNTQERIIQQAIAVSKCGLYDGIFFDHWTEDGPSLADHQMPEGYVGNEAEQRARDIILERIRAETRTNFLIMGNTNDRIIPRTAPNINGGYMEVGIPASGTGEKLEEKLARVENSLLWLEQNLRAPRINGLQGEIIPVEAPDSPNNLRWMRAVTALHLTHSNGYVLFKLGDGPDHYWYDFWDADLGRPLGEKAQLYQEIDGLYIREFTNGWAVYNHSDEQQVVEFPEKTQGVSSGWVGTAHVLPNLDGEMYLRVKPVNPADVNGDGVANILDLVAVAQALGKDSLKGDVNGDGVVNVFDLVFVAGAIGGGGAAPSAYSLDLSIINATDVERWLTDAQGLGVGDANFQRGIRFLEGLLAALTPKETTLLPNYPNPFNPETWIPYHLAREAEVAITIYDTKGTQVRRLALGNQEAGYYAERGRAAYWDGRNESGEPIVSGIYIYQFRAGDYAASRRMVIVK